MPYPLAIIVQLGYPNTGKVLAAQLIDATGTEVGVKITAGFVELIDGDYLFTANVPDGFFGAVIFTDTEDDTYQAAMAITPQEYENADAKISAVLTKVSGAIVTVRNPIIQSDRIDLMRGDDYLVINGRALTFTPSDPDAWPVMSAGLPIVMGVGASNGIEFEGEGVMLDPGTAQIEVLGEHTRNVGKGHYKFTLRTNGTTTETLAEGVLNLKDAWGGY